MHLPLKQAGGNMIKYSIQRLVQSIVTLFVVITIVFLMLRLMPEEGYFDKNYDKLDDEQKEAILTSMGLRDPVHVQLINFYKNLFKGDMGKSITFRPKVPIVEIIKTKIPYSVYFGLVSVVISLIVGISMGMMMACFKGRLWDKIGSGYIVIINAVPAAVYYLFIQLYLTQLFHISLLFTIDDPVTWILPAVSMSLGGTASYAMWIRRYMVDELNKDYIRLAKAKGVKSSKIMSHHVIRNAFVPMAQYLPASILYTIGGSIYIESLYSIPGMGGLLVTAIQRQDNSLVQAMVLIYSSIGIFGLFLGDILMALFDPRIKLNKQGGER